MSTLSDLTLMAEHCGYLSRLYALSWDEERARAFAMVAWRFANTILYMRERGLQ